MSLNEKLKDRTIVGEKKAWKPTKRPRNGQNEEKD